MMEFIIKIVFRRMQLEQAAAACPVVVCLDELLGLATEVPACCEALRQRRQKIHCFHGPH